MYILYILLCIFFIDFLIIGNNRNTLNADNIMPLTIFLILRAGIPHLGAEILLMEVYFNCFISN